MPFHIVGACEMSGSFFPITQLLQEKDAKHLTQ